MFRNIVIAILVAILLTYTVGFVADELFDITVHFDEHSLTPFSEMLAFAGVGILLVLAGFVVAMSVFGILFFVVVAVAGGLIVAGITAFWPMILMAALIVWLVKDKATT